MTQVLTGLLLYLVLNLIGWIGVWMQRPFTCREGHTDHFCCNHWRCRICAAKTEQRGLRRMARERLRGSP